MKKATLLLSALLFTAQLAPMQAQSPEPERSPQGERAGQRPPAATPPASAAERLRPLPPNATTKHRIALASGEIAFNATAGTVRLYDAQQGAPQADIAFIAFTRDSADLAQRPVTFVFNGGPGYASAWLNLGALGPWRLRMDADTAYPSAPPTLTDNSETWLYFTDLVFIDPPATGYSRILGNEEVRKRFFSVDGDIDVLAATIRRWIEENGRMASPKFIAGESYGGFRTPRLAHALQTDQGYGVSGLVMISPVLDFSRFNARSILFDHVARLPSYAAAARLRAGQKITRAQLADVEAYARGDYLADLMRGVKDEEAVARIVQRVTDLTGLDRTLVRNLAGRVPAQTFLREFWRTEKRVASSYDALVTGADPYPFSGRSDADDQMRLGLHAPIISAMVGLYHDKLNWKVEGARYAFMSEQASRQWDWGHGAEAVNALRKSLGLDPKMRVLIVHGMSDVVTPYFETQMVLDQIPEIAPAGRVTFNLYRGGHMFYSEDESRRQFRDDARVLYPR